MSDIDPSKKVADRYLRREVLGEGTYGVVYKAIDTKVNPNYTNLLSCCIFIYLLFFCEKNHPELDIVFF